MVNHLLGILMVEVMFFKKWEDYDPSWIIKASEYRTKEYSWLANALKQCTKAKEKSEYYTYFVDKSKPNKPGSEWQFQESITIENSPEGDIILDIIKNNRVGGIEFLSKVLGE